MSDPWLEGFLGTSPASERNDPWLEGFLGDEEPSLEPLRDKFDPKTFTGTVAEVAKAVPRGVGKFFGETIPKAAAFGVRAAEDAVMAFGGSPTGVTNLSPEELDQIRGSMDVPLDDPDVETTSQALFQQGERGRRLFDESFLGRNPRYNTGKAGLAIDVAEAVGGSLPYAAAWTVSAPLVLATSVGQSGVQAYEQAKRKGANEDQARTAGYLSAPGGLIEAFGAERVASKVLRKADDLAGGALSYVAKNWAAGTAGEATEEFAQALLDEGVAQAIYEKDPFAWEDISRQAGVGGAAGFILTGLALALGARPRGTAKLEDFILPSDEAADAAQPEGQLTGFDAPPTTVKLKDEGKAQLLNNYEGHIAAGRKDPTPSKEAFRAAGAPPEIAEGTRKQRAAFIEAIKEESPSETISQPQQRKRGQPVPPVPAEPIPAANTEAQEQLAAFLKQMGLKQNERPSWLYKSADAVQLLRDAGETIPGEQKTAAQQAREEFGKAFDNLGRFKGKLYSTPLEAVPEYVAAVVNVVQKGIKAGYLTFKEFVADLVTRLGPEAARKIAPIARAEWNRAARENPGLGLAPTVAEIDAMVAELAGEPSEPLGRGLANPGVDQDVRREYETVDEAQGTPETRSRQPLREAAAAKVASDPEAAVREADAILGRTEGQPGEAEEYVIRDVIERETVAALAAGDPARLARNRARQAKLRSGRTEVARALGIRDPLLHEGTARALGRIVSAVVNSDPTEGQPGTITPEQQATAAKEVIAELKKEGVKPAEVIQSLQEAGQVAPTIAQTTAAIRIIDAVQRVQQAQQNRRRGRKIGAVAISANDQVFEYWRNAIQSGPGTAAANFISNKANAARVLVAERFAENLLRSVFSPLTLGRIKGPQWGEFVAMYKHLDLAMKEYWETLAGTWSTESPVFDIRIGQESRDKIESGERRGKIGTSSDSSKFARGAGRIIRIPERLNRMDDQSTKALVFRMAAVANAYRDGKRRKLKGKALDNFIGQQMRDPQSNAFQAAVQDANLSTMAQELGPVAGAIEKVVLSARNDIPVIKHLARYVLPFVTFPFRSTAQAFDATVIGSGKLGVQTIRALKTGQWNGVGQLAARNAIAWGIVSALWAWFDDYLTGTEEIKWIDANMQERTIPPYSIRIPGTDTWVSYARIEPFATAIGLTVDAVKGVKEGEPFRAPKQLLSVVTDKTFLETVGRLVEAMTNPDLAWQKLGRIGIRMGGGFVPNLYRATAKAATPFRPEQRIDKDNLVYSLGKRLAQETQIPQRFGVLKDVPQYDTWGRPIPGGGFAGLAATRVKEADIRDGDKVILAYNRAHPDDKWRPGEPARDYKGRGGKELKMTDEQYARFTKEAGELADRRITAAKLNTKNPTQATRDRVKDILESSRKTTKQRLAAEWNRTGR